MTLGTWGLTPYLHLLFPAPGPGLCDPMAHGSSSRELGCLLTKEKAVCVQGLLQED